MKIIRLSRLKFNLNKRSFIRNKIKITYLQKSSNLNRVNDIQTKIDTV